MKATPKTLTTIKARATKAKNTTRVANTMTKPLRKVIPNKGMLPMTPFDFH
jgi:hypothetical protein